MCLNWKGLLSNYWYGKVAEQTYNCWQNGCYSLEFCVSDTKQYGGLGSFPLRHLTAMWSSWWARSSMATPVSGSPPSSPTFNPWSVMCIAASRRRCTRNCCLWPPLTLPRARNHRHRNTASRATPTSGSSRLWWGSGLTGTWVWPPTSCPLCFLRSFCFKPLFLEHSRIQVGGGKVFLSFYICAYIKTCSCWRVFWFLT